MKTFKDQGGREWTIAINVAAIKRVRDLLKIDLLQVIEGDGTDGTKPMAPSLLERLHRDPILLCDLIYVLCKEQADTQSVSDEDFGKAMAGDAIEAATVALLEELVLFCPSPRSRAILQRILAEIRKAMEKAQDLVEKRIDGLDLDGLVKQALGNAGS